MTTQEAQDTILPFQQLPKDLGGYQVVTGLLDIRVQPNHNPDLVSDVTIYDLPPNGQTVLFSSNDCKIAQFKQKNYARFFAAHSNDVVSLVLSKKGNAELFYNHTTGSYGSLKLRRLYRRLFEGGVQGVLARGFLLFLMVFIADSFIGSLVAAGVMGLGFSGTPVMVVFLTFMALFNPVSAIISVEIYYRLQAKKTEGICSWLRENAAPQVAVGTATQYSSAI